MVNRITQLTNAYESTITAELSSVGSSITLADATGLTVPFYLVIEPANASQREYVYVDALVGNVATIDSRYLAGSAAGSGLTHPAGSTVRMSVMSQHVVDMNDRVDDLQSQINAVGDHGGLTGLLDDDHTQYYNAARHTKAVHDALALDHGALGGKGDDDHPHYLNVARHDADDHSGVTTLAGLSITESQISDLDHNDADAIHDNVASEIAGITLKASPHEDDWILIEDSQAGNAKKRATVSSVVNAAASGDHGVLSGLLDDDHTQYHTDGRAATWHDSRDHSSIANTIHPYELASGIQPDGTVATPGVRFQGDGNSGFYVTGNNGRVDWAGNGIKGGHLSGSGLQVIDGSVALPSLGFTQDGNTGLYRHSADVIGVAAGATLAALFHSGGIQAADGAVGAPSLGFHQDGDTGFYRRATNSVAVAVGGDDAMFWVDGGASSSVFIQDGLTDVGNVETLRANRGSGTADVAIGYFSSWRIDPVTGKVGKTDIIQLAGSPRFPGVDVIDRMNPVDFKRVSTGQREWGVLLDEYKEIGEDMRYLTTKGDEWGHGPDEMAHIALAFLAIKDLRFRVAALEAA